MEIVEPPGMAFDVPFEAPCESEEQTLSLSISVHGDAPPGAVPIIVTGVTTSGVTCQSSSAVMVHREYETVEIRYKSFILCEVAGPTPPDPTLFDFFAGDNRPFGYAYSANKSRTY